jgi:V/A-type H+-transporting ATPase subunit A
VSENVTGRIVTIRGNMVTAATDQRVVQNSIAYCCRDDGARLLSEIIRVRGTHADLQVFEETRGLKVGDEVEFQPEMLSATLGPGLLGQIYDGLQNPLPRLAEDVGYFLEAGNYVDALDPESKWAFTPKAPGGDVVEPGDVLGTVPEGIFDHQIMVPLSWEGHFKVASIVGEGELSVTDEVAKLSDDDGNEHSVTMQQTWPVKIPLGHYRRRLLPSEPLVTRVRIVDSLFPVALGGTYCIPGPFGAGKTVLQQIVARHAEIDIVVVVACGERAGEVVEVITEFPELEDPRTGRSLMERTVIICNTSAMPVSAREASVYMGVTLGEYYRQMGLNVLVLADSTSRWAQALREISGRLEEIPGEEAYPAYLESRIADFYERAGAVELHDGRTASVTVGGSVSPAGGSFEEPVTQSTLKVVGAFLGLSRDRAEARRYPAIDPLESWSRYTGIIDSKQVSRVRDLLRKGGEVRQMMTVVGEEGTPLDDFIAMLKSELFDSCYLQQNAFNEVDAATNKDRQQHVFNKVLEVIDADFAFESRDQARDEMFEVRDLFINWNYAPWDSDEFKRIEGQIDAFLQEHADQGEGESKKQKAPGGEGEGEEERPAEAEGDEKDSEAEAEQGEAEQQQAPEQEDEKQPAEQQEPEDQREKPERRKKTEKKRKKARKKPKRSDKDEQKKRKGGGKASRKKDTEDDSSS